MEVVPRTFYLPGSQLIKPGNEALSSSMVSIKSGLPSRPPSRHTKKINEKGQPPIKEPVSSKRKERIFGVQVGMQGPRSGSIEDDL